jgi:hypothetical protein
MKQELFGVEEHGKKTETNKNKNKSKNIGSNKVLFLIGTLIGNYSEQQQICWSLNISKNSVYVIHRK